MITRTGRNAALIAIVLVAVLGACGKGRPPRVVERPHVRGSEYVGTWQGAEACKSWSGSPSPSCALTISQNGDTFFVKNDFDRGQCRQCEVDYDGIYVLTAEGNLKKDGILAVVISFDQANNQAIISGHGMYKMTKIQ